MKQLEMLEKKVIKAAKEEDRRDFLELADAVALDTRQPVQDVERVIRMLLQERILVQDDEFKIFYRKADAQRQGATPAKTTRKLSRTAAV